MKAMVELDLPEPIIRPRQGIVTAEFVVACVCKAHLITREAIFSKARTEDLVLIRWLCLSMAQEFTGLGLRELARYFRRDANAIVYARTEMLDRCALDTVLGERVRKWREFFAAQGEKGDA